MAMVNSLRILAAWFVLGLVACSSPARAQVDDDAREQSSASLRAKAQLALRQGEAQQAIEMANALINQDADSPGTMLLAADVYLRCGKVDDAVKWFDRYLQTTPEALPDLWQRGIALYFAGDFKRGAAQFEVHRKVNPHDVETAAWHFLCRCQVRFHGDGASLGTAGPQ